MKKANLHSCNVLSLGTESKRLWHFTTGNGKAALSFQRDYAASEPLASAQVAKNWRSIWQRKLNIAWLPPDQVFLKALYLPAAEPDELVSMVEFQLEKVSPVPVAQIVWAVELLPRESDELQAVIVIVVERDVVETFLGRLEEEGYLADRLELSCLNPLLEGRPTDDGVWIYAHSGASKTVCLVAWWFGGKLEQLQLLHLPATESCGGLLVEELTKTAWAGEFEGWFRSAPKWNVVADRALAELLEAPLRALTGDSLTIAEPVSVDSVAELGAKRASKERRNSNLLPTEHSARYKQQFVDRLWMAGLGAVLGIYLIGVLIYFGAVQVLAFQKRGVEKQVASLTGTYTNAVWLKARVEVLQNQLSLKYAALDSLKAASDLLPPELTLSQFTFSKGRRLTLVGTAPSDQDSRLTDYNSDLRRTLVNGEPLFSEVEQPNWDKRGQNIFWRFNCELNRPELQ